MSEQRKEYKNEQFKEYNPDGSYSYVGGCVYLLKPKNNNVYKIGQTIHLEKRITQISKKHGFEIVCVHFVNVSNRFQSEQIIQNKFSKLRLGGDWFALDDKSLQEVITFMDGLR